MISPAPPHVESLLQQRDSLAEKVQKLEALVEDHKDLLNDLLESGKLPEEYLARAAVLLVYP